MVVHNEPLPLCTQWKETSGAYPSVHFCVYPLYIALIKDVSLSAFLSAYIVFLHTIRKTIFTTLKVFVVIDIVVYFKERLYPCHSSFTSVNHSVCTLQTRTDVGIYVLFKRLL